MKEISKIDHMMTRCDQMVGMYYVTLGKARGSYGPLTPIEYELLGYLAVRAGEHWPAIRKDLRRRKDRGHAMKLAKRFVAEVIPSSPQDPFPLRFLLKARQGGFDGPEAERRRREGKKVPRRPKPEEVIRDSELKGSLVAYVLRRLKRSHPDTGRLVHVYHSTDALFKLARELFEPPALADKSGARTFQFSIHGPDYTGLLKLLCQTLFEKGINIEWIHQTATYGLFLVALTATAEGFPPDKSVEKLLKDLVDKVNAKLAKTGALHKPPKEVKKGEYTRTFQEAPFPSRARTRMDVAACDAPGILSAVTTVLADRDLNIEEISVGPEEYLGIRQSHVRITVSHPESIAGDHDFWAEVYNALVSTIGVYGAVFRWSKPSDKAAEAGNQTVPHDSGKAYQGVSPFDSASNPTAGPVAVRQAGRRSQQCDP